ncbi:calpain-5-like, partial [Clarias magur]
LTMFSSVKPFEGQQFAALKKQCQQNRTLFEDPLFPAQDSSTRATASAQSLGKGP